MSTTPRVTFWNEFRHEKIDPAVQAVYPDGLHEPLVTFLCAQGFAVRTAILDEPEHGLSDEVLNNTDVLLWWGHMAHDDVSDTVVEKVQARVLAGMGLIVLHSGHHAKIFKRLMGTTCNLRWREAGEIERLWVIEPGHPIAEGIGDYIELPATEMYGERFDVPEPETVVFISWYEGGEVFRSGLTYSRGRGKLFYFSPGHETYPIYRNPAIQQVILNAVKWAAPQGFQAPAVIHATEPLSPIRIKA